MTRLQDLPASLSRKAKPFLVLTGHFFNRLFQNDVFPFEEQLKEKLFALLAILAAVGGHVANSIFIKYMMAVPDYGRSWEEKCYFLTLFMLLLAFAVVLEWDVVFLDKRDYSNLMSLPIRPRTMFYAKFASFAVFIALYTLAVNVLAVFVVATYLAQWKSQTIGAMLGYMGAHLMSALAANFTVLFMFVLLQAVLLALLNPAWFKRVSLLVRFVVLVAIIFLLLMFLVDIGSWRQMLSNLAELKTRSASGALAFPPLWFTGLYEVLLGSRDPMDLLLARTGVAALLAFGLVYVLAMRLSYHKHLGRSGEAQSGAGRLAWIESRLARPFDAVVLRHPVQRAVFHFFAKTLRTSPMHKVRLAGTMAAALGLALLPLVLQRNAPGGLTVGNRNLLAGPLVLSFFLLVGLRSLAGVPLASEANWVFETTENAKHRHYFVATKKAIAALTLLPLFVIILPFYAALWGLPVALLHLAYGLACSLVLMELLFFKFRKIPFTCSPASGKANLHVVWFFCVLGFLVYVLRLAALEKWLFQNPSGFPYFFLAAGVVFFVLVSYEEVFLYPRLNLVYAEEPEPALITLESQG